MPGPRFVRRSTFLLTMNLPPSLFRRCAVVPWAIAGALCLVGCSRHAPAESAARSAPAAPTVTGEQIRFPADSPQLHLIEVEPARAASGPMLRLNGRLAWDEDVTVRVFSPFAGRVQRVEAKPGGVVEAGAPLAVIASPDFGQTQADARRAATDLVLAERNATRLRELAEHDAAAAKEVQAAEADLARAQAEASRARARLALFGPEDGSINSAFTLRSPVAGTVVERGVSPGQEVRPDQMLAGVERLAAPLFVVTDPSRLWLLLDVTESEAAGIAVGQRLQLRVPSHPDRTFEATLEFESDALDPVTRTVKARARVDNRDRQLKAEQLVSVEVQSPEAKAGSVEVPTRAVFLKGDRRYVFAEVSPGCFERRVVRVDGGHDRITRVVDGLKAGDRVVSNGATLLDQVVSEGGS